MLWRKLLEKVIFREDLKKFSTWDPELTEKPVTNTIPDERTARDSSSRKRREERNSGS
jgi:cell division protease FtsH